MKEYFFNKKFLCLKNLIWPLIYVLIIILLYNKGVLLLIQNDDFLVINLLKNKQAETLILSYPLSSILAFLYYYISFIPWLSVLLFSVFLICIWIYLEIVKYITKRKELEPKKYIFIPNLLNFLGLTTHVLLLVNISITSFTVWFVMTTWLYFLMTGKRSYLTGFSFLLRFDVAFGLIPLLVFFYFLFNRSYGFSKKKLKKMIPLVFVISSIVALQLVMPSQKERYWRDWNTARSFFLDYKQEPANKNFLNAFQIATITRSWWIHDEELLPTESVIKSASNKMQVLWNIINTINKEKLIGLLNLQLHWPYWFLFVSLLLLAFLILLNGKRDWISKLSLCGVFSFIVLLFCMRSKERVTLWLLLGTNFTFLMCLFKINPLTTLKKQSLFHIITTLGVLLFIYLLYFQISRNIYRNLYWRAKSEREKKEFYDIKNNHPEAYFVPSIKTPLSVFDSDYLIGPLFEENDFLPLDRKTGIGPAGWGARHPFSYEFYDISTSDKKRKYSNFYEFMISKNTYFIGSVASVRDQHFVKNYYNLRAPDGFEHKITIKRFRFFALAQIKLVKITHFKK